MELVGETTTGDDYEHWPDDATQLSAPAAPVTGYDTHNGLRAFQYYPTDEAQAPAAAPAPAPPATQPIQYCQPPAPPVQYMQCYPQMPYGYPPQYACPAPAYYGYPQQQQQPPGMPYCPPGYTLVQAPAPAAPAEVKPAKPEPRKWQGRSKAEVEEDNQKIAQREGAYDARKVQPIELQDDQIVWCIETDQTPTLR